MSLSCGSDRWDFVISQGNWVPTEAERERQQKELAQQQVEQAQQQAEQERQQRQLAERRAEELAQCLRELGVEL